jgi:hypothetical protein
MNRFLLILTVLISQVTQAQSLSGTLSGIFSDATTKKPLYLATATLYSSDDTAIYTYRLIDEKGALRIQGIPQNRSFYLLVTFSGYRIYRRDIKLSSSELNLGQVLMQEDTAILENALVKAEIPPVVIRNDTIEFNASAFKTFPDALVEDLLKKLPGVEVDRAGNITSNGRRVTQIKVDGREFFGNDPKVASRNLPANIIDKVQVTDDADDRMTHPNAPEWEIGKVINLKLKKDVKSGIFGKIYAGGGTDSRYEAGGIMNTFRDTLQASVIGYANNLSQPAAFSAQDIQSLGGFQRSGFNDMNLSAQGNVASVDGVNFGGNGMGIQKTNGIGTNINEQFGSKTTANVQYFIVTQTNKLIN